MIYEDEIFKIYYNSCDKDYIEEVIHTLNLSLVEYLSFFAIEKLNFKIIIKFYDKLDYFKVYYEQSRNHPYKKGVVGSAKDNEILFQDTNKLLLEAREFYSQKLTK